MTTSKSASISKVTATRIGSVNTKPKRTNNNDINKRLSNQQTPQETPGRPLLTKKARVWIDADIDNGNCTNKNNNGGYYNDTTDDDDDDRISPSPPSPPRQINRTEIGSVFDKEERNYIAINHAESVVDYCLMEEFIVSEINSILKSLNLSDDDKNDLQSYVMQREEDVDIDLYVRVK